MPGTGTSAGTERQMHGAGKSLNLFFFEKGQRTDKGNFPLEQGLEGKHGADLTAVKHVEKEGFDDIVLMVAKADLITFEAVRQLEKQLPPLPRA